MTLEETILELTARTPSGGCCRIGETSFSVRYCADLWEWEYLGEVFWDPVDLAETILRKNHAGSRLVRFYTGKLPDQRKVPRIPRGTHYEGPGPVP